MKNYNTNINASKELFLQRALEVEVEVSERINYQAEYEQYLVSAERVDVQDFAEFMEVIECV